MRRQARQWSLMILYAIDVAGHRADRALDGFFHAFGDGEPLEDVPPWDASGSFRVSAAGEEARSFARDRVEGVSEVRAQLDEAIQAVSRNWRLARMATIDRNVLRLGAFELIHRGHDVPRKVAINEAVELAKLFGASDSGAFVNGILDRIGGA